MYYPIALVGPSGSGKTTIINRVVERYPELLIQGKSSTTRSQRNSEDALFYVFLSRDEFEKRQHAGKFLNTLEYAGNLYGTDLDVLNEALKTHHVAFAMVESAIQELQRREFPLKVVRIVPENQTIFRGAERLAEDYVRQRIPIKIDTQITNKFGPGGIEKAAQQLAGFLQTL